jgi:hypothetical protein|tara:strand:+ start:278 stop:2689 length:2412 start_codon:yes stop_codon:yes gene_type:complete
MALRTQPKTSFPSHAVSDIEKAGEDYGLQVANAIEHEWFRKDSGSTKYYNSRQRYNNLRLYARGEQSVQKYKDELSINGDLSYLNLDWKPVPIIPKFVDIVVNGISERTYDLKAFSQDPSSKNKRTKYVEAIAKDMKNKDYYNAIQQNLGQNVFNSNMSPDNLPQNDEELSLHMQLDYKQSIEIAEEEALNNVMALNDYDLIKKRLDYDITVLGLACIKNEFNTAEGIKIKYVDPVDIVFSYTDSPYFEDLYYVGEITKISMPELMKRFPSLTNEELKEIEEKSTGGETFSQVHREKGFVHILNFEYKTYKNQTYKIKQTSSGADKALQKDDTFNPPKDSRARFEKVDRAIEVLYCGAKIIGFDKLLDWGMAENMTRPKSDVTKCHMSYNIVAPRIYKGRPESLVGRMMSFADMIQLTHLKMQQVLSRMVPDGIYMDADGLAEIDLGNGTNYNPQEALNMYFQTGSVIGRSMTQDGDFNQGKAPIQEIQSGSGNAKLGSLINSYNYYLQMMRDVTGLNEARDGSAPDKNALVGVQKLAAANSNTATRHILQGGLFLTLKTAECISLRISDVLEYSNTKNQFVNSLGRFNVATLDEIKELHLHDFGIFIELAPDEEEKQILENNIQMALQKELINLDDAIDIREIRNLKLANQLLKLRRRKKQELDRQTQMQNIQAQSRSNAEAAQAAAQAEMQKEQALAQTKIKISEAQKGFDIEKMEREAQIKFELMEKEFMLNMRIKDKELQVIKDKENNKEDRKDERTRIQASQQSELIEQRKKDLPSKSFESSGFDNLDGFGLEQFEPR